MPLSMFNRSKQRRNRLMSSQHRALLRRGTEFAGSGACSPASSPGASPRAGCSPVGHLPVLALTPGADEIKRYEPPPRDRNSQRGRLLDRSAPFCQSYGRFRLRRRVPSAERRVLYMSDKFHTLANSPTYRLLGLVFLTYTLAFAGFAFVFVLLKYLPGCRSSDTFSSMNYLDAMFLSVETMATIGYGVKDVFFQDCRWFLPVLVIQTVVAVLLSSVTIGLVYTRVSRSQTRAGTVVFSDRAAIQLLDGEDGPPSLVFRIGELRKHQLNEAHLRCYAVAQRRPPLARYDKARCMQPFQMYPLTLRKPDSDTGAVVLLALPQLVIHRIDKYSPLHPFKGLQALRDLQLEIIVLLEGVECITSSTIQARHSYTCDELVVNARFEQIVSRGTRGKHVIDFRQFHTLWIPLDCDDGDGQEEDEGLRPLPSPTVSVQCPGDLSSSEEGSSVGSEVTDETQQTRSPLAAGAV